MRTQQFFTLRLDQKKTPLCSLSINLEHTGEAWNTAIKKQIIRALENLTPFKNIKIETRTVKTSDYIKVQATENGQPAKFYLRLTEAYHFAEADQEPAPAPAFKAFIQMMCAEWNVYNKETKKGLNNERITTGDALVNYCNRNKIQVLNKDAYKYPERFKY